MFTASNAVVYQFASRKAINEVAKTYGDADAQTAFLKGLLEKGWFFTNAEGGKIGGLLNADGKEVMVGQGDDAHKATPSDLPLSFLNASEGMTFPNSVPQLVKNDFKLSSGDVPAVEGITLDELTAGISTIAKAFGIEETAAAINNGLRLAVKEPLKPKSARASAEEELRKLNAARQRFWASGPKGDLVKQYSTAMAEMPTNPNAERDFLYAWVEKTNGTK